MRKNEILPIKEPGFIFLLLLIILWFFYIFLQVHFLNYIIHFIVQFFAEKNLQIENSKTHYIKHFLRNERQN